MNRKLLRKYVKLRKKIRFFKKPVFLLPFLLVVTLGGIFSQDAIQWINSYSSTEFEENSQLEKETMNKIYYYWQLESLKRAVSPRYIKLVDIKSYKENFKLLNTGVLFTYYGLRDNEVSVCGNFSVWDCIPMQKNKYGVFFVLVPVEHTKRNGDLEITYQYKFKVDEIFEHDPVNPNKIDDGLGSFYSEFHLEKIDINKQATSQVVEESQDEDLEFKVVEFQIYKPEANTISLVGDFNNWNPEHDYLVKDKYGMFTLRKKLKSGEYLYNFIIDGKKELDTYNSNTRYKVETGELSSFLKVDNANPM